MFAPRLVLPLLLVAACGDPGFEPVRFQGEAEPQVLDRIRTYSDRVEAAPAKAEAHAELGLVYEAGGLWSQAARCFAQARELEPSHGEASLWHLHEAIALRWLGDLEAERRHLEAVVQSMPEEPAAWYRLGVARLQAGEFEAAREAFVQARGLAPDEAAPHLGLAEVENALGNWEPAEESARAAIQRSPALPSAHYARGIALRGLGRMEEAREELAIGSGGTRPYLADPLSRRRNAHAVSSLECQRRAEILAGVGRGQEAVALLQALVREGVENPGLLNTLASQLLALGQVEQATSSAQRALELDPRYDLARGTLALCAQAEGNLEEALALAREGAQRAPRSPALQAVLGDVYMARREFGAAYTAYERAVELEPTDPELLERLGTAAAVLQRYEDSRRYLTRTLELAPLNIDARLKLIGSLLRLSMEAEARAHLERAVAQAPNHPQVQRLRGQLMGANR